MLCYLLFPYTLQMRCKPKVESRSVMGCWQEGLQLLIQSFRDCQYLLANKNEDCDPNIIRDASQTYSLRDLNSRLSLQSSYLLAVGDGSFRLQSRGCGVPNPRLTAKSSFTPTRMRTTTCYTQSRKPAFLATLILVETPYEGQAVRPAPRIP